MPHTVGGGRALLVSWGQIYSRGSLELAAGAECCASLGPTQCSGRSQVRSVTWFDGNVGNGTAPLLDVNPANLDHRCTAACSILPVSLGRGELVATLLFVVVRSYVGGDHRAQLGDSPDVALVLDPGSFGLFGRVAGCSVSGGSRGYCDEVVGSTVGRAGVGAGMLVGVGIAAEFDSEAVDPGLDGGSVTASDQWGGVEVFACEIEGGSGPFESAYRRLELVAASAGVESSGIGSVAVGDHRWVGRRFTDSVADGSVDVGVGVDRVEPSVEAIERFGEFLIGEPL